MCVYVRDIYIWFVDMLCWYVCGIVMSPSYCKQDTIRLSMPSAEKVKEVCNMWYVCKLNCSMHLSLSCGIVTPLPSLQTGHHETDGAVCVVQDRHGFV